MPATQQQHGYTFTSSHFLYMDGECNCDDGSDGHLDDCNGDSGSDKNVVMAVIHKHVHVHVCVVVVERACVLAMRVSWCKWWCWNEWW